MPESKKANKDYWCPVKKMWGGQLLRGLRCKDGLRPGVQDQYGQHSKTPSLKNKDKIAEHGNVYL